MKNKKICLFILILIYPFSSGNIFASEWVEVAGNDNVIVYADKVSIRRQGAKVKVWTKWMYTEPRKTKLKYPEQNYQSTKDLSIYNCLERTSALLQETKFDTLEMLNIVESQDAPDQRARYSEIPPDTLGEAILDFACKEGMRKNRG